MSTEEYSPPDMASVVNNMRKPNMARRLRRGAKRGGVG